MKKFTATIFLAALCTVPLGGCASDPLGLQSANSMGSHPELDAQVKDANADLKSRKITGDTK
jgi:hypothetical protein